MTLKRPDFYPLSMASEKCHIMSENLLNDWLDHKVPLYIRLDALPCQIVRYLGGGQFLLKDWERKIKSGMDYYQHEKMPEFKIRQFYPEKDAEIESRLMEGDLGICRYTYNGHAHGYWRVKATPVTRFAEDHYVLTDMDTVRKNNNIAGAITVYGKDDRDYLIFQSEVFRDKSELFIDANELSPQSVESMPGVKKEKQTRISRPERIALYVMLKEHYLDGNGEVNFSKMAEMLTVASKKYGFSDSFSDDTIAKWIKRIENENL